MAYHISINPSIYPSTHPPAYTFFYPLTHSPIFHPISHPIHFSPTHPPVIQSSTHLSPMEEFRTVTTQFLILETVPNRCLVYTKGVSKSFRTQSITKETTTNTRQEVTQRVMAAKLTRLTHKIAIQLHLVAESYTICSSCSRRPFTISDCSKLN
jgi:hypothetical protein